MTYIFMIIGKNDNPVYEAEFPPGSKKESTPHLSQFILHSALDPVDEAVWKTSAMYLKVVDKFSHYNISAFVTASHMRLMLLHDKDKRDEDIKNFFNDAYELYLKILINPFYIPNTPIQSSAFDSRIRKCGAKYLV